ncbi:MAG: hypothetical protein ACI8TL_001314 [Natronomonas sp.]|jgi:hypothetical protein
MAAEEANGESADGPICPECGEQTVPGSDKCYSCGAAVDSGARISLEMWEYGGGLIAAFGFFMTPIITALPALYCAYRIYDRKPKSTYGILAVLLGTVVFWVVLPTVILPG